MFLKDDSLKQSSPDLKKKKKKKILPTTVQQFCENAKHFSLGLMLTSPPHPRLSP